MKLTIVTLLAVVAISNAKSYEGYKVLRTASLTQGQANFLKQVEIKSGYDFWKSPRAGYSADIMASPGQLAALQELLSDSHINFEVMVDDVEKLSQKTRSKLDKTMPIQLQKGKISFDDYHTHDELNGFLDEVDGANDFAQVVSMGKSLEGRDMKVLVINKAGAGKDDVFIECGIHAREWISPAMCTYIIDQLMMPENSKYIENLNFHILPSANPDGYTYTITDDRLWRKTRSDHGSIFGCKGVDMNRNFGYHYDEGGASHDKCSDTYNGPEAFSEIESKNIRDYLQGLNKKPILAQAFHSYSQLWLYPYGYKCNTFPENVDEIRDLGEDAVKALEEVHGTVFDPINSAELYPASGDSNDWYKGGLGARFAYTIELRDTGNYGFLLPPNQIIPSGEELWAAQKVTFDKMIELAKKSN